MLYCARAMDLQLQHYLLAGLVAVAAGAINALAGGGTLLTFPTLLGMGITAKVASITNTLGLLPGPAGGAIAQINDLRGQRRRLWITIPAGLAGGLFGGWLLLLTSEKLFNQLVPVLILTASLLLAVQEPVRNWLVRRISNNGGSHEDLERWSWLPVGAASVYGGYFGAGLSVILLAALGITTNENLTRLNAIKQVIGFSANISAAVLFVASGQVIWPVAGVMAAGALLGGTLGGRLAGAVKPSTLRWMVVAIGVTLSVIYFVRG